MLDVNDIRTVTLIEKAGSIQAAASEMGLTQPALTKRLKALEDKLGFEVFQRLPRGVRLTRLGERLAHQGTDLLLHARDIEADLIRHQQGEQGSLRVGVRPCIQSIFFRKSLLSFSASYPRIHLRIDTGPASAICDAVRGGSLDFAIIALGYEDEFGVDPALHHALEFEALFRMPVSIVVKANHPVIELKQEITAILNYPLACDIPPANLRRHLSQVARSAEIAFEGPRLLVDDYDFILRLVARSEFWTSVFSENESAMPNSESYSFLRDDRLLPPMTVGLCTRKNWEMTKPAQNLVDALMSNASRYRLKR
ncbi:MAG: LysR family transcriptional regulator [Pseudomonadota bacterium]